MHETILTRWFSTLGSGLLTASLLVVGSGCDKAPQQTKRQDGESAETVKTATAARLDPGGASSEAAAMADHMALAAAGRDEERDAPPAAHARPAAANVRSGAVTGPAVPAVSKSSKSGKTAAFRAQPAADFDEESAASESAFEEAPAIGIRLAPDVRLPIAAMPIDFTISPVAEEARQQIIKDYYREVAEAVMKPTASGQPPRHEEPAAATTPATTDQPASRDAVVGAVRSQHPAGDSSTAVADSGRSSTSPSAGILPSDDGGSQADNASELPAGEVIEDTGDGPTVVVTNRPEVEAARERADWRFKALFGDDAYNRMLMYSLLESRLPESAANSATGERQPVSDGD